MVERRSVTIVWVLLLALGAGARGAGPFQQVGANGLVMMEAEDYDANVSQGGHDWVLVTTPAGYSGAGAMQALPDNGTNVNTGYVTGSPRLDYKVNFVKTGTVYVWVRAYGLDGSADSLHSSLDEQVIATADRISNFSTSYTWTNTAYQDPERITFDVTTPGLHTFNLYMREDGAIVDKIVLTTNPNYTPTGMGPSLVATLPDPADGTVGVTAPLFQWAAGASAVFHDVYFGTDPNPPLVASRQPFAMYYHIPGLQPGTTYYWKVDEIEADGTTIYEGPVWTFMSEPLKNYAPAPADAATGALPGLILTWKPGKDASSYQVYFGTDQAAVASGAASTDKGKSTEMKFDTGALRASTVYYWRVDALKADGSVVPGDVWSFSTADAGPTGKIQAEVWLNIGSGTAVTDLTSNARYPGSPDSTQYLDSWLFPPGSTGGSDWANNYGDRLTGWLKPDQTGDYTFWISGDDLSELWLSTDGSPTNAKMIAQVTGWTDAMDWDGNTGSTNKAALKSAPITLEAGQKYFMMTLHKEGGGGDSVGVAWQGPGIASRQLVPAKNVDMFSLPPLQAFGPDPANGAMDVAQSPVLNWMAGDKAQKHEVYLGQDKAAVAAADATSPLFQGQQAGTTFAASGLEWGKTYYWRVDEINTGEADSPWKGAVWSFTTANFIPVDNFETYTDKEGEEIFSTWIDGFVDKSSGSTVGYTTAANGTFGETAIVHRGKQSMPLAYDNSQSPFYSEAVQTFAPLQDWTGNGVTDLSLWVRGYPAVGTVAVTETGGKMTLTGSGTDIWNNSDQFTFAYKTLTGDGTMIARVVDKGTGTNTWAKGGVMIRDSLDGGSTHAMMILSANSDGTASNGYSFQRRLTTDGASTSDDGTAPAITTPYWVKIERVGDGISGYVSADGKTWRLHGTTQTIAMTAPVYIGIAVTSHAAGEQRTMQFDSISTTGNVSGAWQGAVITSPRHNSAQPMYVVVEDSAGKTASASDATMANVTTWTEWKVPLSSLTGVNLAKVKKLTIGVGDRANPAADGSGTVYIDDVRVTKP